MHIVRACVELIHFLYIRTSNLATEAEGSFFLRFEPENVLNMFSKYRLSSTRN